MTDQSTSRFISSNTSRVSIPGHREKCEMCTRELIGVYAPWGTTRVCGGAVCQAAAQLRDQAARSTSKELVVIEHSDDWEGAEF